MAETLSKASWKDNLKAAVAAAAIAGAPMPETPGVAEKAPMETVSAEVRPKVTTPADFDVPYGQHPEDKFLNTISMLESSGGKNLKHHPSKGGLHQGATAIGSNAIMPNTVRNIAGMLHNDSSVLKQKLGEHYKDPEMEKLASLPDPQMVKQLKANPKLYTRAARYLATHLDAMHPGDESRKAFGWRWGVNRPSQKISDADLKGSGYVRRFNELMQNQTDRNLAGQ